MKYPRSYLHIVWLELVCFVLGHRWKSSPRKTTEWYENDEHIPYGLQKATGNALWEDVAWWHHKCLRCRMKLNQNHEVWHPWYKELFWAFKHGCRNAAFFFDYMLTNQEGPLVKRRVAAPLVGVLGFLEGFFICFDRLPPFTWYSPHDGLYFLHRWSELKCTTCGKAQYETEFCSNAFHLS